MSASNILSFTELPLKSTGTVISWDIEKEENWLLRGNANSGKPELLSLIEGKSFLYNDRVVNYFTGEPEYGFNRLNNHIAYLNFRGLIADHRQYYYQQRYQATETDDVATLRSYLCPKDEEPVQELEKLIRLFGLSDCLDREIIKLSSGEYRKASVIQAIVKHPELIVLDEPYTGLDTESVSRMDDLLEYMAEQEMLIILSSHTKRIAPVITHILELDKGRIFYQGMASQYQPKSEIKNISQFPAGIIPENRDKSFTAVLKMVDTTVTYANRIILDHINWKIQRGEKWWLSGKNGAGKSMLLSLVFADHPQVYSNEVYLFDRRRGTGESIWDVKERIGYFSSELFLYYDKTKTTNEAAFHYLKANPYKKRTVTDSEKQFYHFMLEYLQVGNFCNKPLHSVPYEVQRIFILMSVFLSGAPFIILDEPYHGLDDETIQKLNTLLAEYCKTRTLIFVSHNSSEIPSVPFRNFHLEQGSGQVIGNSN